MGAIQGHWDSTTSQRCPFLSLLLRATRFSKDTRERTPRGTTSIDSGHMSCIIGGRNKESSDSIENSQLWTLMFTNPSPTSDFNILLIFCSLPAYTFLSSLCFQTLLPPRPIFPPVSICSQFPLLLEPSWFIPKNITVFPFFPFITKLGYEHLSKILTPSFEWKCDFYKGCSQTHLVLAVSLQPLCVPIKNDFCPVNNTQHSPGAALQTFNQWQANHSSRCGGQSNPITSISQVLYPQPWQTVFCLGSKSTLWDATRPRHEKRQGPFHWYCLKRYASPANHGKTGFALHPLLHRFSCSMTYLER